MLDYCFLLNTICSVCARRGVTASMETGVSQKDEELAEEMRRYYTEAKGG